jgi:hypothetical protein
MRGQASSLRKPRRLDSMRYRLRTLLIVLVLGPPRIGWTCPPVLRAVTDWLRGDEIAQSEFDRILEQLLVETTSRSSLHESSLFHGRLIDDFGPRPLDSLPPIPLSDEIKLLFPSDNINSGASSKSAS